MIKEPYKSLYQILLICGGKVIRCKKLVGYQYLITTERLVEEENMVTGEILNRKFTYSFLLPPTYSEGI